MPLAALILRTSRLNGDDRLSFLSSDFNRYRRDAQIDPSERLDVARPSRATSVLCEFACTAVHRMAIRGIYNSSSHGRMLVSSEARRSFSTVVVTDGKVRRAVGGRTVYKNAEQLKLVRVKGWGD